MHSTARGRGGRAPMAESGHNGACQSNKVDESGHSIGSDCEFLDPIRAVDVGSRQHDSRMSGMGQQQTIDRLVRQWRILDILRSRRHGATCAHLCDELGVSRPTVYRDLKVLIESPLPVRRETVNGEVRYLLDGDWPSGAPSAEQLMALGTARRMLAGLAGTQIARGMSGCSSR